MSHFLQLNDCQMSRWIGRKRYGVARICRSQFLYPSCRRGLNGYACIMQQKYRILKDYIKATRTIFLQYLLAISCIHFPFTHSLTPSFSIQIGVWLFAVLVKSVNQSLPVGTLANERALHLRSPFRFLPLRPSSPSVMPGPTESPGRS